MPTLDDLVNQASSDLGKRGAPPPGQPPVRPAPRPQPQPRPAPQSRVSIQNPIPGLNPRTVPAHLVHTIRGEYAYSGPPGQQQRHRYTHVNGEFRFADPATGQPLPSHPGALPMGTRAPMGLRQAPQAAHQIVRAAAAQAPPRPTLPGGLRLTPHAEAMMAGGAPDLPEGFGPGATLPQQLEAAFLIAPEKLDDEAHAAGNVVAKHLHAHGAAAIADPAMWHELGDTLAATTTDFRHHVPQRAVQELTGVQPGQKGFAAGTARFVDHALDWFFAPSNAIYGPFMEATVAPIAGPLLKKGLEKGLEKGGKLVAEHLPEVAHAADKLGGYLNLGEKAGKAKQVARTLVETRTRWQQQAQKLGEEVKRHVIEARRSNPAYDAAEQAFQQQHPGRSRLQELVTLYAHDPGLALRRAGEEGMDKSVVEQFGKQLVAQAEGVITTLAKQGKVTKEHEGGAHFRPGSPERNRFVVGYADRMFGRPVSHPAPAPAAVHSAAPHPTAPAPHPAAPAPVAPVAETAPRVPVWMQAQRLAETPGPASPAPEVTPAPEPVAAPAAPEKPPWQIRAEQRAAPPAAETPPAAPPAAAEPVKAPATKAAPKKAAGRATPPVQEPAAALPPAGKAKAQKPATAARERPAAPPAPPAPPAKPEPMKVGQVAKIGSEADLAHLRRVYQIDPRRAERMAEQRGIPLEQLQPLKEGPAAKATAPKPRVYGSEFQHPENRNIGSGEWLKANEVKPEEVPVATQQRIGQLYTEDKEAARKLAKRYGVNEATAAGWANEPVPVEVPKKPASERLAERLAEMRRQSPTKRAKEAEGIFGKPAGGVKPVEPVKPVEGAKPVEPVKPNELPKGHHKGAIKLFASTKERQTAEQAIKEGASPNQARVMAISAQEGSKEGYRAIESVSKQNALDAAAASGLVEDLAKGAKPKAGWVAVPDDARYGELAGKQVPEVMGRVLRWVAESPMGHGETDELLSKGKQYYEAFVRNARLGLLHPLANPVGLIASMGNRVLQMELGMQEGLHKALRGKPGAEKLMRGFVAGPEGVGRLTPAALSSVPEMLRFWRKGQETEAMQALDRHFPTWRTTFEPASRTEGRAANLAGGGEFKNVLGKRVYLPPDFWKQFRESGAVSHGMMDQWAKYSLFKALRGKVGDEEAAKIVKAVLFDYSDDAHLFEQANRSGLWVFNAIPRRQAGLALRTLVQRPWLLARYPRLRAALFADQPGSEEQYETRPSYQKGAFVVPAGKDENGQYQFVNLGRWVPFTGFFDALEGGAAGGSEKRTLMDRVLSVPLWGPTLGVLLAGRDPRTGNDVNPKGAPPWQPTEDRFKKALQMAAPSTVRAFGFPGIAPGYIPQAARGETSSPSPYAGPQTLREAWMQFLGVPMYHGDDPDKQKVVQRMGDRVWNGGSFLQDLQGGYREGKSPNSLRNRFGLDKANDLRALAGQMKDTAKDLISELKRASNYDGKNQLTEEGKRRIERAFLWEMALRERLTAVAAKR